MNDDFLKIWFAGFHSGMDKMDDKNRSILLSECGKACSDSFSRQIYVEEYGKSNNFDDFLERIMAGIPGLNIEKHEDGYIEVIYRQCFCGLVMSGLVDSPAFCECSRQSLRYNWEAIFGEGNVEVTLLQSILEGKDSCRLLVRLDRSFDCD